MTKNPYLFIANLVILLSEIITVYVFSGLYPPNSNILFRIMCAITLAVLLFWKVYLIVTLAITVICLTLVTKQIKEYGYNLFHKIQREVVYLTFAITVSLAIGFPNSMTIKTGKPDVEPNLFFMWFLPSLASLLVIRIGLGILTYYRSRLRQG